MRGEEQKDRREQVKKGEERTGEYWRGVERKAEDRR